VVKVTGNENVIT